MSGYVLSGFSDEYAVDFDSQLEGFAKLGISNIEIRFADGINVADFDSKKAEQVAAKLRAYGIGVSAIGSPLGKISIDDDFEEHMQKARRVFEIANLLSAKYVRVFSFYIPKGITAMQCREPVIKRLEKMLAMSREYGVTLCHENEAGIYGENPQSCLDLLSTFGGELKCVFDMGNFVLGGFKPYPDAYRLLKDYIAYFHIKDALFSGEIVPCSKGDACIEQILCEHIKDAKSDIFVSMEPHLSDFVGLGGLTKNTLRKAYRFENSQQAFTENLAYMREIMIKIPEVHDV